MLALIFDCDGVLVDTERDGHRVAFNQAFEERHLDCTWSVERYGQLLQTAGGKERMTLHFNETGWPVAAGDRAPLIADLHRRKTELFMRLIEKGGLPLRPGIARLVDEAIAAGFRLAVCSTSNERAVESVVKNLLGQERARHISIFAGDIVAAKKPDPAIYLLAAKVLRLEPSHCVVIEDSNNGLQAAKAAGMSCIVTISSYTGDEDFSLADRVVADLDAGVSLSDCRAILAARQAGAHIGADR